MGCNPIVSRESFVLRAERTIYPLKIMTAVPILSSEETSHRRETQHSHFTDEETEALACQSHTGSGQNLQGLRPESCINEASDHPALVAVSANNIWSSIFIGCFTWQLWPHSGSVTWPNLITKERCWTPATHSSRPAHPPPFSVLGRLARVGGVHSSLPSGFRLG